jgi:two-component system sensor histidine kinase/response regulator
MYNISEIVKPFEKKSFPIHSRTNPLILNKEIDEDDIVLENHYLLRIQDLENRNAFLEKYNEKLADKLDEVVSSNTKFISILAHDLRSPFSSILGVLEMLKESLNDFETETIERYINIASQSAKRTLNLLDNLLTWTIAQNKEKSFNPVKINLSELVNEELDCIGISASQKQIRLNLSIAPNLNVLADLQMVKTILRNLVSNAVKYTKAGGKIDVSALVHENFIEIKVRDTGIGVSSEAQNSLFKIDTFQSTSGTNNEKGTGLGLIICKEFVEINGGKIWLKSEQGIGSEFNFSLPDFLN